MGRIIFLCLLLSLGLSLRAQAAPYSLGSKVKNVSVKVDAKKAKVQSLEKQMKKLESDLSAKNAELDSYGSKLSETHEKIDGLKVEAKPIQEELFKLESELKKLIKQYAVMKLDEGQTAANLYSQKMMIQVIALDLEKLKIKKMENESSDKLIKAAEEELLSIVKTRETLQSLITEIKGQREGLSYDIEEAKVAPVATPKVVATPATATLIDTKKLKPVVTPIGPTFAPLKKAVVSNELFNLDQEPSAQVDIKSQFASPINNFIEYSNSAKGVTFTFSEVTQVISPGVGEVVFAGELSTYGNVVMIDHGGEIRTVLLGNFTPKVRKHDKLNAGELVGYTEFDATKKNTLYFEVRKKNVAQNTSRYLNKNLLKSRL